jgi:hypothetical protein
VELSVDFTMVIVGVNAQLVKIGPINLSVGLEIVVRVSIERASLIRMSKIEKLPPVLVRQLLVRGLHGRVNGYRSIAGEDALMQKIL